MFLVNNLILATWPELGQTGQNLVVFLDSNLITYYSQTNLLITIQICNLVSA